MIKLVEPTCHPVSLKRRSHHIGSIFYEVVFKFSVSQFVPLMYELKIGLIRSKQKTEFTYLNHENSIFIVLELELLHPQRKKTGLN